jgi:hypothetical protein
MGSALQRLEILLIGLVLLIASAVVAILLIVHPSTPAASVPASPLSIAAMKTVVPTRTIIATATAMSTPTFALIATAAPLSALAPTSVPHSESTSGLPGPVLAVARWPMLLLAVGLIGLPLAARRFRRQRMSYTNQNVRQLLAAADAETRTTNVRIMRDLAQQGVLPAALAAAAGIDLPLSPQQPGRRLTLPALPRIAMPRLTFPVLWFPTLRRPAWLRCRARRPITIDSPSPAARVMNHPGNRDNRNGESVAADSADALIEAAHVELIANPVAAAGDQEWANERAPLPAADLSNAETRTIETGELPKTEAPEMADPGESTTLWTAEDRVLAAAAALATLWMDKTIKSTILALDTATVAGTRPVLITLDGHPGEEQLINELPELIVARHPAWRATWRRDHLELIMERTAAPVISGAPLIAPVLTHGRGGKTMRFFPLSSWRHLGIYGGAALGALHALLGSLLYTQSPAALGLAILDHGEIASLYHDVAHLVALPATPYGTLEMLAQAIRRGVAGMVRPLLLVVVEPDDDQLRQLIGLATWLQARPSTPLHLIVVQEHLRTAGREVYATLPALITGGSQGHAMFVPGQGEWPKRGDARLVGRGMRVEGRSITLDETDIAAFLAPLRSRADGLPPVLWDAPVPVMQLETSAPSETSIARTEQSDAINDSAQSLSIAPEQTAADVGERKRQIMSAITSRRQALIDAEIVRPPARRTEHPQYATDAATIPAEETAVAPAVTADVTIDSHTPAAGLDDGISDANNATEVVVAVDDVELGTAHTGSTSRFRAAINAGRVDAPPLFMRRSRPGEQRMGQLSASIPPQSPEDADTIALRAAQPVQEPDNGWPIAPAPLSRVALAELMARVVQAPAIVAGQDNELGVSKNRLVELLKGTHKAQAKDLAELLMAWFDQAGVLVEPSKPGRLRHPRALVTTDLAAIATLLNTTACPDKATVAALWAASQEGRN